LLASLGGQQGQPAACQIEQAAYRAEFHDGRLAAGKAHFVIAHPGKGASLLPLGSPNLSLADPRWLLGNGTAGAPPKSEKALWGTDSTGRRVLIVEPGQSRLECDWSLAGRTWPNAAEFNLTLPPAVVSQLMLTLPEGWSLEGSAGVVTKVPDPSRSGRCLCRWLACCLPREEELQDEFLRQTSIWARSWR
jgi:hypothetical protein